MIKEKYKWLNSIFVLLIFIIIYIVIAISTYNGLLSLLPSLAVIIYTLVIWQGSKRNITYGAIVTSILWIIYNYSVNSYVGVLSETTLLVSNIFVLKGGKYVKN